MEKSRVLSILLIIACFLSFIAQTHARPMPQNRPSVQEGSPVKLNSMDDRVEIDNGIFKITLSNPTGMITSLQYKGVNNILEYRLKKSGRGYWDIMWGHPNGNGSRLDTLDCTRFRVVAQTDDQVEVSFTRTWNSDDQQVPLSIDKRYVILRGASGFYSYSIFNHMEGWPDLNIDEARIAFKLNRDIFNYMVISDDMQKIMPTKADLDKGHKLDYQEAILLPNPTNPKLQEVEDKYQYSCDNKDNHVHGWISSDQRIGFWVIIPSDEFRAGGPIKQDLTSHAATTSLATFFSGHYAGKDFGVRLRNGEAWKKVYGPVFVYLNSASTKSAIWEDAKRQAAVETNKWPYDFPSSPDFPHANERGSIDGRLMVRDGQISAAKEAYVGLATPGNVGSWQQDTKGYQFWNKTDKNGYFSINGVRPGNYNLYAWVPGFIGDYKYQSNIIIQPGTRTGMGELVYSPPRNGPTLWEIGIPDRTAAEFFIPDPVPDLVNPQYINHSEKPEKHRQYGLWNRYTNRYPNHDLVYTVGQSDYRNDWFFAHVNRHENNDYVPTTWQITFQVNNVIREGTYTMQIALASANFANLQVYINNQINRYPIFSSGTIGKDNAIARHGIHGLYKLYSVNISGSQLVQGTNTIYLRQAHGGYPFTGLMYDYIRLEGPPQSLR